MDRVNLICHPATNCSAVQRIGVHVMVSSMAAVEAEYSLSGDIDKLRIPLATARKRVDNLWQHMCFEVFIAAPGNESYLEFNFAPSGEWAIFRFDSYRSGMNAIDVPPPVITTTRSKNNLLMNVTVDLNNFPDLKNQIDLLLGLSAVIEDNNGALSYWALTHSPGKPDFHHRDCFALTLNRPKNSP